VSLAARDAAPGQRIQTVYKRNAPVTDACVGHTALRTRRPGQFWRHKGLYIGLFEGLSEPSAGCLLASYCYEQELFDDQVKAVCTTQFRTWRARLGDKIRAAMALYPPRLPVDAESLADGFTAAIEGAFVLSRGTAEPDIVARQLSHYRNYLERLLAPSGNAAAGTSM